MTPKQHHIVPKWYLDRFVDPGSGLIHVYDKVTATFREQKTCKVLRRKNYYRQDWAPEGTDANKLEKTLGDFLEPKAKLALERLLTIPSDFTPDETAQLLLYIEFQRLRVPRQAQRAKQLFETWSLLHSDPNFAKAFLEGRIIVSDSVRFEYMREMMGEMPLYFARMHWNIIRAANGSSFITSDSPVSFYNREAPPPHFEAGLRRVGTHVLFPLSSELLLIMQHPEYRPASSMSSMMLVPKPEKNDGGIKIDFHPIAIGQEEVTIYNSCLFQLSDHSIVGSSQRVLERCLQHG